jgi:hypothetical protein
MLCIVIFFSCENNRNGIDLLKYSEIENNELQLPEEFVPAEIISKIYELVLNENPDFFKEYREMVTINFEQKYCKNLIRSFHGIIAKQDPDLYKKISSRDKGIIMLNHMLYAKRVDLNAVLALCDALVLEEEGRQILLRNTHIIQALVKNKIEFTQRHKDKLDTLDSNLLAKLDYYEKYYNNYTFPD